MQSHFSSNFFIQNRARLWAGVHQHGPIVVTANGTMQRATDEPSVFTQDSSFWYLTGLSDPDLVLVITKAESYLIVPGRSFVREAFDGAYDVAAIANRSGITTILEASAGWKRLRQELQAEHEVTTLLSPPAYMPRHGLHTLPFRRRLIAKLKRLDQQATVYDARTELAALRCVKQPAEIKALEQAISITTDTLLQLVQPAVLHKAAHEYELESELTYGFRRRGAAGHSFSPIVAAGKHSTTLHHVANDGPIHTGDLIVLDVGAEVEQYAADISRTVSNQPISGRKADVFRAVAAVQDFALSQIKPGVLAREYEKAVEVFMGTKLIELGLTTDPTPKAIRHYFPHATSHFLGLDVHDVGDYRMPWQENMVITCEPGIYIPEEGIGVRIEDDVLITKDGYRLLSAACPRELTPVQ